MKNFSRVFFAFFVFIIISPVVNNLYAKDFREIVEDLELGAYAETRFSFGALTEHEKGNIGFGGELFYGLPIKLPDFMQALGVSAKFEEETPFSKERYIESWNVVNILGGVYADFKINDYFSVRPELIYGPSINIVRAPVRGVDGAYVDQTGRISLGLVAHPSVLDTMHMALHTSISYTFMPEKSNIGNYFGVTAGILIRPFVLSVKQKRDRENKALAQAAEKAKLEAEERQRELELEMQAAQDDAERERLAEEARRLAEEATIAAELAAAPTLTFTTLPPDFTPDGDGENDIFIIKAESYARSGLKMWSLDVFDEEGKLFYESEGEISNDSMPSEITWDGSSSSSYNRAKANQKYTAVLSVTANNGKVTDSEPINITIEEMLNEDIKIVFAQDKLNLKGSTQAKHMTFINEIPDEENLESWKINIVTTKGELVNVLEGTGMESLKAATWDGTNLKGEQKLGEYSASISLTYDDGTTLTAVSDETFTVVSETPKVAKTVEVVENKDGTVSIDVPTIGFLPDSVELTTAKSNLETIEKVYQILIEEAYVDFKIEITGYVNPDNEIWTEDENKLAQGRAETIKNKLVDKGINADRLVTHFGEGKTQNKEFNRRVEFKLTK